MKKLLPAALLLAALSFCATGALAASDASSDAVYWSLEFNGNGAADETKLSFTNATASVKDGILAVQNETDNPRLLCSGSGVSLDTSKISEIRIKVKVPDGATQAKLYFAPAGGKYSEAASFKTQNLTRGEWQEIVFLVAERPNTWTGTLTQFRFDFLGAKSGYELEYIRFMEGNVQRSAPVDGTPDGAGWTMDFSSLKDTDAPYFYGENATLRIQSGVLQVSSQSSNPRIFYYGSSFSVDASAVSQIHIKVKLPDKVTAAQLYFAAPGGKFTQETSFKVVGIPAGQWQEIVIDTAACAAWTGIVSQFRLDLNEASGGFDVEYIKFIEADSPQLKETVSSVTETIPHADRWFTDKEPVTDYAYSFCVVGDTQVITERYPDKLAGIYDWILENKDEKKIEFVFGLGDIVQYGTDEEWDIAKDAISRMDGKIPYSLVRGSSNHDSPEGFNDRFGTEEYKSQFDGLYRGDRIENTYRTFRAGDVDYLFMTLEFGPSDAVLEWANFVIKKHPYHRVIITTHMFLYRDGTTLDYRDDAPAHKNEVGDGKKNNGDELWEKLISRHENIFMVLCGHDTSSTIVMRQTEGEHGNLITQMLINPQGVDAGQTPTGMVAMLYFSDDGKSIDVEYYSTVRNMYYMTENQFTIDIPEYKGAPAETTEAPTENAAPESTEAPTTSAAADAALPDTGTDTSGEQPVQKSAGLPLAAIGLIAALAVLGFGAGMWLGKRR